MRQATPRSASKKATNSTTPSVAPTETVNLVRGETVWTAIASPPQLSAMTLLMSKNGRWLEAYSNRNVDTWLVSGEDCVTLIRLLGFSAILSPPSRRLVYMVQGVLSNPLWLWTCYAMSRAVEKNGLLEASTITAHPGPLYTSAERARWDRVFGHGKPSTASARPSPRTSSSAKR